MPRQSIALPEHRQDAVAPLPRQVFFLAWPAASGTLRHRKIFVAYVVAADNSEVWKRRQEFLNRLWGQRLRPSMGPL